VNTEAFQTIDAGDGASNIELRFGTSTQTLKFLTTGQFQFSRSLSVQGTLSGSNLRVDNDADIWGKLNASGATNLKSTLTVGGNTKVRGNLSGTSLQIDNNAAVYGQLSVTGAIKTRGNLTINSESDTNDAILTFGNNTANQTLKFNNTTQKFEFSTGLSVKGSLSGTTLNIDKNANIGGNLGVSGSTIFNRLQYTWPGSQSANTFLKTDGNGTLTWSTPSVGSSSGEILSLHPEYSGAVYFQSGSTAIGALSNSGSGIGDNYYRWTSTRSSLQDYWISVRLRLPKNFTHFETASGIQLRLRTLTTAATDNYVTFRVIDTAGALVATTNNAALVSNVANTWRTNTITGLTGGTYTPFGYITLLIKMAAKSTGVTDVGYINLNWSNTVP
jgi:hypothetical protein